MFSLGSVFGIALLLSFGETKWKYFGWYLVSLSFFHFSEYVMVAKYSPDKLSTDSFLLNHSPEYQIAAVTSWLEFVLEWWLFPQMKNILLLSFLGLLMMVGGEILRKLAMITAESNFTHLIQTRREKDHVLVTHGIYSLCRHPGYAGWFWWSIGKKARSSVFFCLHFEKRLMHINISNFLGPLLPCVFTIFTFRVLALGYATVIGFFNKKSSSYE